MGTCKFDFDVFRGGFDDFAVHAGKYSKEDAIGLYIQEMCFGHTEEICICPAYVYYGFGYDADNMENTSGYWLTYEPRGNSFDVWAFHVRGSVPDYPEYEIINIKEFKAMESSRLK